MTKKVFYTIIFTIIFHSTIFAQIQLLDTTKLNVETWRIDKFNALNFKPVDTTLYDFEIFHPADLDYYSNINLGTLVSPNLSHAFIHQPKKLFHDFFFISNYQKNMFSPENFKYYRTDRPYTDVFYSTSPKVKEEQFLNLLHTQNVNKNLNIGIELNIITSKDPSTEQNSANTNIASWVSYTGKRYNIHTNLYSNKFKVIENGGIVLTGEGQENFEQYHLSSAKSQISNKGIYLNQEFMLGKTTIEQINDTTTKENFTPKIALGHIANVGIFSRRYLDDAPTAEYYGNIFLQSAYTYDSIYYRKIENTFHIRTVSKKLLGINMKTRIAISNEVNNYFNFKSFIYSRKGENQINNYFTLGIYDLELGKFSSSAYYKNYIFGNRNGDIEFSGHLQRKICGKKDTSIIVFKANFSNTEPGYFIKTYNANHDRWDNNFNKSKIIEADLAYINLNRHFKIHLNNTILNNYIYFDEQATPQQTNNEINILSVQLEKTFYLWKFIFDNRIIYQNISNNSILNLPNLIIYNSTSINFDMFKKALILQIGFYTYFTTTYNAYSYRTSTGMFYLDKTNKTGNYPILNGFVNLKIKNVLLFFKFEHINGRFDSNIPTYLTVNNYFLREAYFRFGVRWWFKN